LCHLRTLEVAAGLQLLQQQSYCFCGDLYDDDETLEALEDIDDDDNGDDHWIPMRTKIHEHCPD